MARWIEIDTLDVIKAVVFRLHFHFIWFRYMTGNLSLAKGWSDELGFSMLFNRRTHSPF